jgi:predicted dehydrogenase
MSAVLQAQSGAPLRLAIVGLVHGHVTGFLTRSAARTDIKIVGIAEPDQSISKKYAERYHLDSALFFTSVEAMLDKQKPEAVAIFTNTFDHKRIVEICAARGIHAMMEKPLAVDNEHAAAIAKAAQAGKIQVIVNYETTWYASNRAAYAIANEQKAIGPIRKMVIHDGHRGPKEIGVPPEFFNWLTDPILNGAGALMDFGCYGADLMTWLMNGERPLTVTAVTQRIKPQIYSKVDDEADILVTYPKAIGIIQASWNWPFDRKDMEIYGETGSLATIRGNDIRVHLPGKSEEQQAAPKLEPPYDDPLNYLTAVVRGRIKPAGLSSLETNVIVTEILDAARRSAATGKTIRIQ